LFLTVVCSAQDPEFIRHFDYDKKAPIGFKELGAETRGDVLVHDITFVSPKGGVVPAYLVTPRGSGPLAASFGDTGIGTTQRCEIERNSWTRPSFLLLQV
jgi:hypothetical protein